MIRFDMREERPVVQEVEKDNTKNDDKSIHEQMLNVIYSLKEPLYFSATEYKMDSACMSSLWCSYISLLEVIITYQITSKNYALYL